MEACSLTHLQEHQVLVQLWIERGEVVDEVKVVVSSVQERQEEVSQLRLDSNVFEQRLQKNLFDCI